MQSNWLIQRIVKVILWRRRINAMVQKSEKQRLTRAAIVFALEKYREHPPMHTSKRQETVAYRGEIEIFHSDVK